MNRYDLQSRRCVADHCETDLESTPPCAYGKVLVRTAIVHTDMAHPTKKVKVTVHAYVCQPPV